jgi:hypothetical protein
LTNITLNNNLDSIGIYAFGDNQLTSIIFPSNITYIGDAAFIDNLLTTVTLPNVTSINDACFQSNQLTNITIPSSVTSIGQEAFANNLLTEVSIVNGLITINNDAFMYNQIDSLIIPSTVTSIGSSAFYSNPLTSITSVSSTPPNITTSTGSDTFGADRSVIDLYIPTGTEGTYVTNSGAEWTGFNLVTETEFVFTNISDNLSNEITIINNKNEIQINTSNNLNLENYSLYNLSGAIVKSGNEHQFSTQNFVKGIYVLKLKLDRGIVSKKIRLN